MLLLLFFFSSFSWVLVIVVLRSFSVLFIPHFMCSRKRKADRKKSSAAFIVVVGRGCSLLFISRWTKEEKQIICIWKDQTCAATIRVRRRPWQPLIEKLLTQFVFEFRQLIQTRTSSQLVNENWITYFNGADLKFLHSIIKKISAVFFFFIIFIFLFNNCWSIELLFTQFNATNTIYEVCMGGVKQIETSISSRPNEFVFFVFVFLFYTLYDFVKMLKMSQLTVILVHYTLPNFD